MHKTDKIIETRFDNDYYNAQARRVCFLSGEYNIFLCAVWTPVKIWITWAASFARESDPTHIWECISSLYTRRVTAGPHQRSTVKAPSESRMQRSASSPIKFWATRDCYKCKILSRVTAQALFKEETQVTNEMNDTTIKVFQDCRKRNNPKPIAQASEFYVAGIKGRISKSS